MTGGASRTSRGIGAGGIKTAWIESHSAEHADLKEEDTRNMWKAFNLTMRIVSSLIGLAMILIGFVWILQGLNLAFRVGFMVGDYHWTIYGAILAIVGIAQVVWSNIRQINPR